MLESVQLNIAAVQGIVWKREIRKLNKFQMNAFLLQFRCGGCPDVFIKGAGETDADRDILTGRCRRIVSGGGGGSAVSGCAARGQGNYQ